MFYESWDNGYVGVELYLTGHVNDYQVFFGERVYRFGEEVEIVEQESAQNYVSMNGRTRLVKPHSKQYISPPLGPKPISSMTSSREMSSFMSRSGSYVKSSAAGSRLM